jgi:hypothetical protein
VSAPPLVSLSCALLGDEHISPRYVSQLFPDESRFGALIARWQQRPEGVTPEDWLRRLWSDNALRAELTDLALSLLFGVPYAARKALDAATPEPHFQGLYWQYTRAHAPALPGGYFGHWSYPPEAG